MRPNWTYAIATMVALGAITPAVQAQDEIIFGISAATGSLQEQTAQEFARRANERLGDTAEVKVYADSQLGNDQDLMQKIKLGSVHLTLPSSILASIAGEYAIFDMPFLVKDRAHLAAIQEAIFEETLVPAAEAMGYTPLAIWENGIRHITNSVRPIDQPADLEGLKIRTPRSTWRVKMFETWGANPTPMAFSEVFVGLQTGVIDGQENPLTNIAAAQFQEVQDYLTLTSHVYSPAFPTAGTQAFAQLDPEVQTALRETALEVEQWAREQGAEADDRLLEDLQAKGMQVNTADREAFVAASAPIYEAFAAEVEGGQAMVDAALAAAD
jgi:tripartite ATP-independent transporter DctP family solute receptor